jgi:hypothetical protein
MMVVMVVIISIAGQISAAFRIERRDNGLGASTEVGEQRLKSAVRPKPQPIG